MNDEGTESVVTDAVKQMDLSSPSASAPADVTEEARADDEDILSTGSQTDSTDSLEDNKATVPDISDPAEDSDSLLLEASNLKEKGNNHVSKNELEDAVRCYRRGIQRLTKLKKLAPHHWQEEQVKSLAVTLYTNLSTVFCKQKLYRKGVDIASKAVELDPQHVKSRYRRGMAAKLCGDYDLAKADWKLALQIDPTNKVIVKELKSVKVLLDNLRESQKKALARAFSSTGEGGSGLYQDKEQEAAKKAEQAKLNKIKEQEMFKKRKMDWEDECVARMSRNEPAITFEEYEKELKEKEEKSRKEKEEASKVEESRRKEERRRARAAEREARKAMEPSENDDDDVLTEKEIAQMRGYKKTADGRVTSYFTRELSSDAKQALAAVHQGPRKLDDKTNETAASAQQQPLLRTMSGVSTTSSTGSFTAAASAGASKWNQAGTWEEKDTTAWCEQQLRTRLLETGCTSVDGTYQMKISEVKELTGDASVAIVAQNKKRYIFDFHSRLKYRILLAASSSANDSDGDKDEIVLAAGILALPDICSTSHEEVEVSFDKGWTKKPKDPALDASSESLRQLLAAELRHSVQRFVNDFNENY
jgi:Activator of Hsp90 ATPase, N-terminal/Tetratricopeptide repeat